MRLTNTYNLPEEVVEAVLRNDYISSGDISVTALLSPPRIRVLRERHKEEITEDVSDRLWAIYGQIVHGLLERTSDWEAFHEERLEATIEGWVISGRADLYKHMSSGKYVLRDYKFVSVYSDPDRPEWRAQLNIYAFLWKLHGFPVDIAQLVLIYRDWRKREAERNPGYPPPVKVVDVPIWTDSFTREYIKSLVRLHKRALETPTEQLPLCTPEERWERGGGWAVMKEGRRSAIRILETEDQALLLAHCLGDKHYVQQRLPEPVRCMYFCNVAQFCDFGRKVTRRPHVGMQEVEA